MALQSQRDCVLQPRVAESARLPWAGGHNPFGIAEPSGSPSFHTALASHGISERHWAKAGTPYQELANARLRLGVLALPPQTAFAINRKERKDHSERKLLPRPPSFLPWLPGPKFGPEVSCQ